MPSRGTPGFSPQNASDPNRSGPKPPILHLPACCILPLKAGKYFFLFAPLMSSFSSLSLLLKGWACSSQFLQCRGLNSWLVIFVSCSPNGSSLVFREGIEQLLRCLGIQYYEHFSDSSASLYEKKVFCFFFKSSIHPCLCIFTTNLLKHNPSLVQVAVLIAVFILSLEWALGFQNFFCKGSRRDTG